MCLTVLEEIIAHSLNAKWLQSLIKYMKILNIKQIRHMSEMSKEEMKNKVDRYGDILWLDNFQKNRMETICFVNKVVRKDESGIYENDSISFVLFRCRLKL